MDAHWTWTYNLIWCVVTIPLLGWLMRNAMRNVVRKIEQLCTDVEKRRSKEMCDEKMNAHTKIQTDLATQMERLWERVDHHKHQKENGGVVL